MVISNSESGDATHHKKLGFAYYIPIMTRGMIPITKNIIVIDEKGSKYEATYLKRAKGLVKNGRARFVNENTICLACPPYSLEDNSMSDNIIDTAREHTENPAAPTMEYVLTRIDRIIDENAHIHDAIDAIRNISLSGNNYAGDSRGEAIAETVKARELTNQQLIKFLEKMYDDLKPSSSKMSDDMTKFQQLTDMLSRYPKEVAAEIMQTAVNRMFSKPIVNTSYANRDH